ncbi:acyl transferase/acyl hydrolase/lysophospholipase, partial [Mycena sp. CBHHK59/15]
LHCCRYADSEPVAMRLLSMDGGGIRGLSTLLILDALMYRIKAAENLDSVPRPCDYFDLMEAQAPAALMLGRLRMGTADAIEAYADLSKEVFSDLKRFGGDDKFKAHKLEGAIKKIVQDRSTSRSPNETMKGLGAVDEHAKRVFVCAMSAHNMNASIPPAMDCTIWEAARATSAAPTFFKPIEIGPSGRKEAFISGGLGCNNPTAQVLKEAERMFPNRHIACIVSVGTGHQITIGIPNPSVHQHFLQAMAAITTDCERTNEELAGRFQRIPNVYFRLSVEQGMQNINLDEWDRLGEVISHTKQYMRLKNVDCQLSKVVKVLRDRIGIIPTADLSMVLPIGRWKQLMIVFNFICQQVIQPSTGITQILETLQPVTDASHHESHNRSGCLAHTRVDILAKLYAWANDKGTQSVFWLNGMAGTGKSTITQSFAEMLANGHLLGASFFCLRAAESCSTVECILPTVAYNLAQSSQLYRKALVQSLDKERGRSYRSWTLENQFQRLIVQPSHVLLSSPRSLIVVVDALDECSDPSVIRNFLAVILRRSHLNLKFFITSRPETQILKSFSGAQAEHLILHNIERSIVAADITTYLTQRLSEFSQNIGAAGWPSTDDIAKLVEKTGKLFIFASTAVRYISQHDDISLADARRRLSSIISSSSSSSLQTKTIDGLYSEEQHEIQKMREGLDTLIWMCSMPLTCKLS